MDKSKDNFNVFTFTKYNKKVMYTHWSKGLTMIISKNGIEIRLNSKEVQELVNSLPKTIGGKY